MLPSALHKRNRSISSLGVEKLQNCFKAQALEIYDPPSGLNLTGDLVRQHLRREQREPTEDPEP